MHNLRWRGAADTHTYQRQMFANIKITDRPKSCIDNQVQVNHPKQLQNGIVQF